ncbi:hypothetical protein Taro_045059 [Colocasia esculenta]|uniref:Uncharacterized protein n=1 Tax=Colocasia esculenta TaxID=4460 RepID=A0A843X3N3_COLES|nr:hypothetical protein [Colocasia esculenta]
MCPSSGGLDYVSRHLNENNHMASRGRRGGVPTRDGEQRRDEPRREDQGEQQAPAPQGPVLHPPPPVDYGVFMQGLVQATQTQAHTQAALQAQLVAQFGAYEGCVAGESRCVVGFLTAYPIRGWCY